MKSFISLISVLSLIMLTAVSGCSSTEASWPSPNWETSSPQNQGMDDGELEGLEKRIPTTADIVIVRNGYIVYEYQNHDDYYSLGENDKAALNSVTKSITSALIGIAIKDGYIQSVDQTVTDFFPEWADVNPGWSDVTLKHVLTMTAGFHWPEATDWNYSTMPMRETENWVEFVVGRDFIHQPGEVFNYSTGASQLLTAIIHRSTGRTAYDYAREKLFDPIGVGDVEWLPDPQGIYTGGRGMWMSARDLARFGLLYLNNGMWNGENIIPADYVEMSTKPYIDGWSYAGSYGFHWWTSSAKLQGKVVDYYYSLGYGGKLLFIVPDLDIVAVFIAYNPNNPMQGKTIFDVWVLGSIEK